MAEFSIIQLVSWDAILANGVRVFGSFVASGQDFIGCSENNIFINLPNKLNFGKAIWISTNAIDFDHVFYMSSKCEGLLRSCRWSIVICKDLFILFHKELSLRFVLWWLWISSDHKEGLESRRMFPRVAQLNTKILHFSYISFYIRSDLKLLRRLFKLSWNYMESVVFWIKEALNSCS